MVEEQLRKLSAKRSLDGGDAFALIQLLQEQTTPILSLKSAGSSNAPSSDRRPAANAVAGDGGRIEGRRAREPPETGKGGAASRGVSPKRALFGGRSGSAAVLDVNSLEEFPPMQPHANTTCRRKEKKATKPRRITLTSMSRSTPHQTPSSHPPHFTPLPPANESWSPHPAFVGKMVTTSSAPSPLSEERKLLRKERSRQIMQRRSDSRKVERGLKNTPSGRVESTQCRSTMSNATHDKSITHQAFSTGSESAPLSPSHTDGALFSSHPGTVLTSTPAPATSVLSVLSVDRVSNRTSLEHLAQLHSRIITDRLVPNITSEIHFVVQLLTCTQPTRPLQNVSDGSENLFRTVENCVYFAVEVLYNIRNFLTALDTATLQLLSDNTRIKQFEPKLATFLSVALERVQKEISSRGQSHVVPQSALTNNRVPFQEDTDNLRNFPNMKVFHAFKKQRDSFYSILREWEANHNMPHWNFQSALRDKIRALMSQPPELCSLDHLATLFQRQLMESCSYAAHLSAGMERLAEGPLKNLNPDKLMKLSERFQRQSHVGTGTCPPATFSESEQFFSSFVTSADSYTFNCHLTTALHHELLKLHSRCGTVATREVPEVLHALRVCAKFLGYLDFLPYTTCVCPSLLQTRTASHHTMLVSRCVNEAVDRDHISLTIPWAVDYMSMIDSHALQVPQVHSLLCQMVAIYRSTLLEGGAVTADSFLVLACLGWLLETPNVPSSVFFQCLKSDSLLPSKLPQSELVTRDLLYICCPYLACIRVTLAEFASGLQSKTSPIRKIKPVPAGPDTTHTPVSPLQLKLQESFFRNHPPLFKQLCDTVSERVSETAVQLVQSEIVPEHVRSGLQSLALWICKSCSDQPGSGSCINLEELFHRSEAVRKVAQVSEQTFSCVLKEATQFCREHSEANTSRAMSALVCATIPKQVVTVAIGIAVDWSIERCMKWINSKLRGIVFEEVSGGYEKLRKAVRTGVKASQSHHSDNLQSHSNISVPSTNRSYQSLSSDISSGLPSPTANSQTNNRSVSSLDESSKHSHPSPSSGHYLEISDHSSCSILQSPTQDLSTSALPTASQALLRKPDGKGTSSKTALCPMSLFMKLTSLAVAEKNSSPQKDCVLEVVAATESVREFLLAQVTVVEGGYSPHLLPRGTDKLVSSSVQYAALLVAHGLIESSISEKFTSLWCLLKGLKQDIPAHLLLSADSFSRYLQQVGKGIEGVWSSLACLLEAIVTLSIVATDVIEALWLCRIRQSSPSERQSVIRGSVVFLAEWFGLGAQQKDGRGPEVHGVARDFCFVRLLRLVASESDSHRIDSFRNHPSLPFLAL